MSRLGCFSCGARLLRLYGNTGLPVLTRRLEGVQSVPLLSPSNIFQISSIYHVRHESSQSTTQTSSKPEPTEIPGHIQSPVTNQENFTESLLPDKLFKTVEVELLGYEPTVLDSYQWFILTAASHLGIEVGRVWAPRKSDKERWSLLKSVHIFKKHQVQYEVRTYHRFFTFHKLTGSTASTYLEYIQRNIPEGVAMKVTKVEVLPKPDFLTEHRK